MLGSEMQMLATEISQAYQYIVVTKVPDAVSWLSLIDFYGIAT